MNAYTPGPWLRDGRTVYALVHAGWRKGVEHFKNRFYLSVQKDAECTEEEAEANARLIAAAPELLEFAEWAMGQLCGDSGTGESYWEQFQEFRKGKSAIAKAEGNT